MLISFWLLFLDQVWRVCRDLKIEVLYISVIALFVNMSIGFACFYKHTHIHTYTHTISLSSLFPLPFSSSFFPDVLLSAAVLILWHAYSWDPFGPFRAAIYFSKYSTVTSECSAQILSKLVYIFLPGLLQMHCCWKH